MCVRGGVALASLLSVSVGFGSDGTEWYGGTASGLHWDKLGKQPGGGCWDRAMLNSKG